MEEEAAGAAVGAATEIAVGVGSGAGLLSVLGPQPATRTTLKAAMKYSHTLRGFPARWGIMLSLPFRR